MNIVASAHSFRRQADGFIQITVNAPEINVTRRVDISFEKLRKFCGWKDPLALDFLTIASICYVVDKMIDRNSAGDGWTRELDVSLPVSQPEIWQKIADDLAASLCFLTGDIWNLTFTALAPRYWRSPKRKIRSYNFRADAVCLFSGGLDSLTGAIDLLENEPDKKVLFIGHHDGPTGGQDILFRHLFREYPDRGYLLRMRVGHQPRAGLETTLRSRSLVFLALGFYAARFYGPDVPLYACENGVIALNVPLTPSRSGSCSTRTMHPYFLDSLYSSLRAIGFTNPLINPLELKTKGECVTQCLNPRIVNAIAQHSVSCSHGTRRQNWVRRNVNNCGYCVPCLFRRASLHAAGLDNELHYGFDVCENELSVDNEGESADDLRAMTSFLRENKSEFELAQEIARIAPTPEIEARAAMLARGFEEVRALIRDKGAEALCRAAGVSSK